MGMRTKATAMVACVCMLAGLASCGGQTAATTAAGGTNGGNSQPAAAPAADQLDGNTLSEPLKWDENGDLAKKLNCMTLRDFHAKYERYLMATDTYADISCAIVTDKDSATVPVLDAGGSDMYYYGTETINITDLTSTSITFDVDATKFKKMKDMSYPDEMVVPSTKIIAIAFKKDLPPSESSNFTYDTDGATVKAGEKKTATIKLRPQYTDMVALKINKYTWLVKVLN